MFYESNAQQEKEKKFQHDLEHLLNMYSIENQSNTPDFLLAQYLMSCLDTWKEFSRKRDKWYGREE